MASAGITAVFVAAAWLFPLELMGTGSPIARLDVFIGALIDEMESRRLAAPLLFSCRCLPKPFVAAVFSDEKLVADAITEAGRDLMLSVDAADGDDDAGAMAVAVEGDELEDDTDSDAM